MSKYHLKLIKNLKTLYDKETTFYTDVTLNCVEDGSHFDCHRIILAASSEYFLNLFKWSAIAVVNVHNEMSGEVLKTVINYIYSGIIDLTTENMYEILRAANYFSLQELIEDCVEYLLNNITESNCVDILHLAYELDLKDMFSESLPYVALIFTCLMNDTEKSSKLFSLPTSIMVDLFKSDDLVTRDPVTDLPTTPVEREKHILECIIHYCENAPDNSASVSSFLHCLKWPLFKLFNEEKFAINRICPYLDEASKTELEKLLLEFRYSDWFLSPGETEPNKVDESMFSTRAFSCSERVITEPIGSKDDISRSNDVPNETITPQYHHYLSVNCKECIRKVDVLLRQWNGCTVVGGIGIYIDGENKKIYKHIGMYNENGTFVKSIELEEDEHIIGVYGNSGLLIHNLTFKTSKNKTHGPFGGNGGRKKELMSSICTYRERGWLPVDGKKYYSVVRGPHQRIPLDSLLVGVTGDAVMTGDSCLALQNVHFVFREMLPTSKFLINLRKKYDVSIFKTKKVKEGEEALLALIWGEINR